MITSSSFSGNSTLQFYPETEVIMPSYGKWDLSGLMRVEEAVTKSLRRRQYCIIFCSVLPISLFEESKV